MNDGTLDSNTATVSITASPLNDPPVAGSQSVETPEDAAKAIMLQGTDIDGDTLSFTVTSGPSHGALTGTGANRTYTPATDYHGPDSFEFTVHDGHVGTPGTVTITVLPVNDPPVAVSQSVETLEDAAKAIPLTGSDVDGDPLTYRVVSGPAHGVLTGTAPDLTYVPAAGYTGPDTFTFVANDGLVDSPVATVTVDVTHVNHAPVAAAQSVSTSRDTALPVVLTGSDVDGDALSVRDRVGTGAWFADRHRRVPHVHTAGELRRS